MKLHLDKLYGVVGRNFTLTCTLFGVLNLWLRRHGLVFKNDAPVWRTQFSSWYIRWVYRLEVHDIFSLECLDILRLFWQIKQTRRINDNLGPHISSDYWTGYRHMDRTSIYRDKSYFRICTLFSKFPVNS